eukprot:m.91452 g.91452  ORF g.91452 m.91452 type:complete len:57 (-) comp14633_c1_seq1:120-290(-)
MYSQPPPKHGPRKHHAALCTSLTDPRLSQTKVNYIEACKHAIKVLPRRHDSQHICE